MGIPKECSVSIYTLWGQDLKTSAKLFGLSFPTPLTSTLDIVVNSGNDFYYPSHLPYLWPN